MPAEIYHQLWDLVDEKKPFKAKPMTEFPLPIVKTASWPRNMTCCQNFVPITHRFSTHVLVPLGPQDVVARL